MLLENFTAYAAVAIRNLRLFDDLLAHMGLYGSRQMGIGPAALWNAFKRLTAGASASEKTAIFSGTANRVYRLGLS